MHRDDIKWSTRDEVLDESYHETTQGTEHMGRLVEDDRTFFCSELVAKAFKILGVIENDTTSCT